MGVIVLLSIIYLIPTIVAISNKKRNASAVAVLNILLGWLFVPWVVALTWAVCKDKQD